jgi:hypothetical protein
MKKLSLALSVFLVMAISAPVLAQSPPFIDTFSTFGRDTNINGTPEHAFDVFSGFRTDLGAVSYGGGATPYAGLTHVVVNGDFDGANVQGEAYTIAPGFFAAKNYAQISVDNAQEQGYLIQSSHGTHTTVEFFSPDALPVRSVFHWTITGNASSSSSSVYAGMQLRFLAGHYPTTGFYDFFSLPGMFTDTVGNISYNLPLTLNQPIDLFYHSVAFISLNDTEAINVAGGTFSAEADFANTFIMDRIDLYDTNDALITNWTMTDRASGQVMFTQDGRTAAASGASAPEPGTLLFLALGGTLVLIKRRRY